MFRPTARRVLTQGAPRNMTRTAQSSRFLSTAPPHEKSRSWKNSALRWTAAGALIYYYNTSNIFADEPTVSVKALLETPVEPEPAISLEAVVAQREARARAELEAEARKQAAAAVSNETEEAIDAQTPGSAGELEEEASQQGAFNEETGEINWDCPCLGGMAHGPCGEEFREAFSCFVYSKEEPKGVECIDKFKSMQNCFRAHPDIYGSELDEEEVESEIASEGAESSSTPAAVRGEKVIDGPDHPIEVQGKRERATAATEQVKAEHGEPTSETDEVVPKAWHEAK